MGLLTSPVGQGLLAAGLGAMGSRGNTMQAIGRGGLLGLSLTSAVKKFPAWAGIASALRLSR